MFSPLQHGQGVLATSPMPSQMQAAYMQVCAANAQYAAAAKANAITTPGFPRMPFAKSGQDATRAAVAPKIMRKPKNYHAAMHTPSGGPGIRKPVAPKGVTPPRPPRVPIKAMAVKSAPAAPAAPAKAASINAVNYAAAPTMIRLHSALWPPRTNNADSSKTGLLLAELPEDNPTLKAIKKKANKNRRRACTLKRLLDQANKTLRLADLPEVRGEKQKTQKKGKKKADGEAPIKPLQDSKKDARSMSDSGSASSSSSEGERSEEVSAGQPMPAAGTLLGTIAPPPQQFSGDKLSAELLTVANTILVDISAVVASGTVTRGGLAIAGHSLSLVAYNESFPVHPALAKLRTAPVSSPSVVTPAET